MKAALCATIIFVCVVLAMAQKSSEQSKAQKSSELFGHVRFKDKSPVTEAVLTIGNYSVTTDKDGYYTITFLKPGRRLVSLTPPGKRTRSFKVMIGTKPTQKDFVVNW